MRELNSPLFESEAGVRDPLVELALDLRNCWDDTTNPEWRKIEPELWARTHNPWVVLQTASLTLEAWDLAETEELYDTLENKVVPAFYNRNGEGIATEWVTRMRESMSRLTPWFSADRAVRE